MNGVINSQKIIEIEARIILWAKIILLFFGALAVLWLNFEAYYRPLYWAFNIIYFVSILLLTYILYFWPKNFQYARVIWWFSVLMDVILVASLIVHTKWYISETISISPLVALLLFMFSRVMVNNTKLTDLLILSAVAFPIFLILCLINNQPLDFLMDENFWWIGLIFLASGALGYHLSLYLNKVENNQLTLNRDMDAAKEIQKLFIPSKRLLPGIHLEYLFRPTEKVSGDFFNVINLLRDFNICKGCPRICKDVTCPKFTLKYGIFIGDVVGHGIPAALNMAKVSTLLTEIGRSHASPKDVVRLVNNVIYRESEDLSVSFTTLFYGTIDLEQKIFTYTNAGHERPLFMKAATREITTLDGDGFPLGIFDRGNYTENFINIEQGDKLFFYTDGLLETIANDRNSAIGLLTSLLENNFDSSCEAIKEEICRHLNNNYQLSDDTAFLVIEFLPVIKLEKTIYGSEGIKTAVSDMKDNFYNFNAKNQNASSTTIKIVENILRSYFLSLEGGSEEDVITVTSFIDDKMLKISCFSSGELCDFQEIVNLDIYKALVDQIYVSHEGNKITVIKKFN